MRRTNTDNFRYLRPVKGIFRQPQLDSRDCQISGLQNQTVGLQRVPLRFLPLQSVPISLFQYSKFREKMRASR